MNFQNKLKHHEAHSTKDQDVEEELREKQRRKVKAMYILTGLAFSGILFLLSLYAWLTGQDSLLLEIVLGIFAGASAAALYSGIIFPFFALILIPLLPLVIFYYYWKCFR